MKKRTFMMIIFLFQLAFIPLVSATAVLTLSSQINQETPNSSYDKIGIGVGAGLAVGLAGLGAGIAIAGTGTAAISALAEKPETFFRSLIIVAIAEAIAIYGLIVGILLWLKL